MARFGTEVGRFAKNEWTIHKITVETVEPSDEFPTGSKTTAETYNQTEAVEIWSKNDVRLKASASTNVKSNYIAVNIRSPPYPKPKPSRPSGGCYFLSTIPSGVIPVMPFFQGAHNQLKAVLNEVERVFKDQPFIVEQWEKFSKEEFPPSDDANEYIKTKPLFIPLFDQLFSHVAVGQSRRFISVPRSLLNTNNLLQGESTNFLKWQHSDKNDNPTNMHRRLLPDERLESLQVDKPFARQKAAEKNQEYHRLIKMKDAEEDARCEAHGVPLLSYKEKRARDKDARLLKEATDRQTNKGKRKGSSTNRNPRVAGKKLTFVL